MSDNEIGRIPEDDTSTEGFTDFLSRKGAIELLCEIEGGGSRFNELSQALDISTTTLSKRLDEAQEVSLVEVRSTRGDRGTVHAYALTEPGLALRHQMIDLSAVAAYQALRDAQERFEEKAEEVREWTVENGEILARNPHAIREFIGDLQQKSDAFDN